MVDYYVVHDPPATLAEVLKWLDLPLDPVLQRAIDENWLEEVGPQLRTRKTVLFFLQGCCEELKRAPCEGQPAVPTDRLSRAAEAFLDDIVFGDEGSQPDTEPAGGPR